MKTRNTTNGLLILSAVLFAPGCLPDKQQSAGQPQDTIAQPAEALKLPEDPKPEEAFITVVVVPCANGYDYEGSVPNPFLEKHLASDPRVKVIPFPYKKMGGQGYHGVFDKKDCGPILEKVKADFLVMTLMKGNSITPEGSNQHTWGYDTKVLNTASMEQFDGISASGLPNYESIDGDIKGKIQLLIEDMMRNKAPVQVSR